jgi:membrane associated rhomboid family serine protease
MLFLWVFGNNVEDRMGRVAFLLFYLVAGIVAAYAQAAASSGSQVPLIGASGAVAGVLGAYLVMYPGARVLTLVFFFFITMIELPAVVVLGLWFVLQAFQGLGSLGGDPVGVAWFAHIGGFVFGAVVALAFYRRQRLRRAPASPWDY